MIINNLSETKKYEIVYTPVFKSVRTDLFIELKVKDFN